MSAIATDNMLLTAPEVSVEAGREPKDGKPRLSVLAYTGGVMTVHGWGDVAIDLAGLDASGQIPLLADHDARIGGVVGHGEASVMDGRLIVSGVVSGAGDAARQIVEMTSGGFAFQASVGVEPLDHERIAPNTKAAINGRSLSSPRGFSLVKKGKLREVSITPLGADSETSVSIAASRRSKEGTIMSTQVLDINEAAIRTDERERIARIEATCAAPANGWGVAETQVSRLKAAALAGEIDERELSAHMLTILRESRPRMGAFTRPAKSVGTATAIEAALLARMGLTELGEKSLGPLAMEYGAGLKANHILDLCREALVAEGIETPSGREELVRASLSTYSLPVALSNLANKVLLDAYNDSPATWRAFCAVRSVNNFKAHTAVRPSFATPLEPVAPGGELKHGTVGEWFSEFRADTFGRMISVDRRDLINDDLSALEQTARSLGRAAMRKLADLVYTTLLGNEGAFFSSANGNLIDGTDSALSLHSLSQAIQAMRTQRDEEGNDLDILPTTLIVPPQLAELAKSVLESEFIQRVAEMPTGNSLRRAVSLEVEPRLSNDDKFGSAASAKHWFLFAAPSAAPMVVGFLSGKQEPTVEFYGIDAQPDRLAVSWRVYHDFGAAFCDPRAAVRVVGQ